MPSIVAKVFGTKNEREVSRLNPQVGEINDLEAAMQALSDEEMRAKTAEFRALIRERVEQAPDDPKEKEAAEKAALDELLAPAFALVREAGRRVLQMRHFDVQLIGGMVLHHGKIAEMKTGEGKTLVATLPVYLNALAGHGVHVVTVNDYLARRDSEWMGRLYTFLGLTVGVISHDLDDAERKAAYAADITYGTNNEFGFDYLRDNMKFDVADCVQRGHHFGIVDEVDSILIDEARTPLIISGPSEESTEKYYRIDRIIPSLKRGDPPGDNDKPATGDFFLDEKQRTATLTEEGVAKCEEALGVENMYDIANMELIHHVYQALRAHTLYKRDVDYVVKEDKNDENGQIEKQVIIVDEFTGRLMPGRRWSDGLHQAVEAKEGVKIQRENQTLATITFQNYFRMYKKLAGMTGTAETEANEFHSTYKLDLTVIPTNKPLIRKEFPDVVYRTEREKFNAVVDEIADCAGRKQPVLVGTISVEKSERVADLLRKKKIAHVVLNAKHHEKEAEIVAQAGRMGAVTIATNMAGRGTDILLGGNPETLARAALLKKGINYDELAAEERAAALIPYKAETDREHDEVVALGGLHIIGTERHESRRIDNQLRGRAGRQGDPGSSRFYLSLEDDLLRIFGGEKISGLMLRLGMEEGTPIESKLITKRIAAAQEQVEAQHFDSRKHLLEYDDVMNKQREAIYGMRHDLLAGLDQKDFLLGVADGLIEGYLTQYCGKDVHPDNWNVASLRTAVKEQFGVDFQDDKDGFDINQLAHDELHRALMGLIETKYNEKEELIGAPQLRHFERLVMLQILDNLWKDNLLAMDHLKEGIGLRGYGQRDPLIEYKKESFDMFQDLMDRIENDSLRTICTARIQTREEQEAEMAARRDAEAQALRDYEREMERRKKKQARELRFSGGDDSGGTAVATVVRNDDKVGRNDPCPCGSGKKYKKCHGVA
ncbi:MAG: preprotein translocase subunit SecA [Acidobacteria bacterium]|nr:MAG: preprotein translocase subunit SecA [Acidobacteriota bacterium]